MPQGHSTFWAIGDSFSPDCFLEEIIYFNKRKLSKHFLLNNISQNTRRLSVKLQLRIRPLYHIKHCVGIILFYNNTVLMETIDTKDLMCTYLISN